MSTGPAQRTDRAHAIVDGFASRTGDAAWRLERSAVAARLHELIDGPDLVRQGGLNLCGPAAVYAVWLRRDPAAVATFALIHGGGGSAWDWHLVAPALRGRGHDAVAVDLPSEDESAGWEEYTDVVVRAVGDRRGVVVVGHSLGGFTAPLVCARSSADLLVLVAAMIPAPGELFADWWANAGYEESGYEDVFYHDVPPQLAAEARRRERNESSKALQEPWPLEAWPETPTRYLLCRDDRMFQAAWARRHAAGQQQPQVGAGRRERGDVLGRIEQVLEVVQQQQRLPALEMIAINGIGTDAVDLDRARARKIRVTTTPDVLTDDVADLGMGLLIAAARQLCVGDRLG